MTWRCVSLELVHAIHDRQLSEHGGSVGIRDAGAIESAVMRPQNLAGYVNSDIADRAAAYAFGLARNHGFVDGNKRTAWVIARLFLADNGTQLRFNRAEAVKTVEALAAGTLGEAKRAEWFRERIAPGSTA
jgi:death-on-curing protein